MRLVIVMIMMIIMMVILTCPHWKENPTLIPKSTSTIMSPSSGRTGFVSSMVTALGFISFRWKVPRLYFLMVCFFFLTCILHILNRSARCLSSHLCSHVYLSGDCLLRLCMYFVATVRFFAYVNNPWLYQVHWTNTATIRSPSCREHADVGESIAIDDRINTKKMRQTWCDGWLVSTLCFFLKANKHERACVRPFLSLF